ncbi:Crp/Fnr family transcriptional regulator [Caulobacter sp. RL271]|jgi:CRP-like cAMP-binding protein|uniref:Crp/Fnr family transcriptional regulator n=1 Tax=Caulobacter segnis TaxID=88688 RepID=A0ABY4ZV30_9CAUL|nr:Crp/Fnr family transcriptional regulator [Caulobacter segnis]USQ96418.1 Crp/Fnr family transcriptional regulator [Caulobacter segnis]
MTAFARIVRSAIEGDAAPPYATNRLLAALRPDTLTELSQFLVLVDLPLDAVLFDAGDDVEHTYLPCGPTQVSLLVVTSDGQEIEAASIGFEGAIGGVVSAGFKPAYGRAVVRVPGRAFCIPTARLEDIKTRQPAVADLFDRAADVFIAQMMQVAACNALHPIEQRACRWLLFAHDRSGDEPIRLTQETLAQMLGVQRTTISAVARVLQDAGVIDIGRGKVTVLDRPALEKRACECHEAVENHFRRVLPKAEG